ncbi:MAG: efflux RND transporter periplasmic adaptor subunit [Candidatus Cryptobacteroides sp.]|nr:efflux RND transporter periplasmic adaptor subunit [Bacteroidales bacterium]MDY6158969.1 efflux RND transporter periplasmic adaptor subunit [Candidatus Cryptobacteroides sp.]
MRQILKSVTVLAAAALAVSCGNRGGKADVKPQEETKIPLVEVYSAAYMTVSHETVYSSTVQANIVNNISPQTAGRIRKLNVEVGDFVSKGQILAEIDRMQLEQAELKLKNDERELERCRQLLNEGGLSQSDFDSMELAFKVSKTSYDNLVENTILRSPVSGVITARNYDVGDMYSMSSPVYTVQQITPVKLLVAVSETDYTRISKGDKCVITADALPGESFRGSVVRIYPVMDPSSHTFNVEVQVPNANARLRPGMYARVSLNMGDTESIVIPDAAIVKQQGSGQRTVFVLKDDDTAEVRLVTLGKFFDGQYEVLEGLSEGDRVVSKGQASLRAGVKVEVVK